MKNGSLSYRISMAQNSKVHKPHSYNKSYVKDKNALPSYQDITSRVSTEIYTNFQSDEKPSQAFLESMEISRRRLL